MISNGSAGLDLEERTVPPSRRTLARRSKRESTRGGSLRWVVAGYLVLIGGILAYNARVTNNERASARVVNISARQRATAERYINDVLLKAAGFRADPQADAVVLQHTARALLVGGSVASVQGANGTVRIPPASRNWKVVAKLRQEEKLIAKLVAAGDVVLHAALGTRTFNEDVTRLRVIGAQVANITNDAVGQMTLDLDASLTRFVLVGLALGLVGTAAAFAMAVLLRRSARKQAKQFGSLVHRASDLVTVIDEDGTIRYQSASIQQVLNLSPSQIVGSNLATLIHVEDLPGATEAWGTLARRPNATGRFEYRIKDGSGSWRHVESAATNLLTDPTVGGLVLNTRDVTERHEIEATLRRLQIERGMLLERTVQATEQQRKRVAAELHDGAVQQLTTLAFKVATITERVGKGEPEGSLELLERVQADLLSQVQGLRKMMTELRPPILDERGLEAALRDHVKSMEPDVDLRFSVKANNLATRLSPAQEILLYRVAQEAMSNLVKHSQAEHAWVKLQERSGRILLEIRDDGVGFDTTHAAESGRAGHFGILGMRERVELAGGIFELDSVQGVGTLVRAYLPRER